MSRSTRDPWDYKLGPALAELARAAEGVQDAIHVFSECHDFELMDGTPPRWFEPIMFEVAGWGIYEWFGLECWLDTARPGCCDGPLVELFANYGVARLKALRQEISARSAAIGTEQEP
jgi:hypothetical protein